MFTIQFTKEAFQFSCAHLTIFGPRHAERLHGHNYRVEVMVTIDGLDAELGLAFDFNLVKPMIRSLCDRLDEHVLIADRSPYLNISESEGQIEMRYADRRYSFPANDVLRLPIVNVTSEELARYFAGELRRVMTTVPRWTEVEVNVAEASGQGVSFVQKR